MNAKRMMLALSIALLSLPLFADEKDIDFDQQADFSKHSDSPKARSW